MADTREELITQATDALKRIQEFDPQTLERKAVLGEDLHFGDVVPAAEKLIGLYQKVSSRILAELDSVSITKIKTAVEEDLKKFNEVLSFSAKVANPTSERDRISGNILNSYDSSFKVLMPFITYSACNAVDFQHLESEAQAHVDRISVIENQFKSYLENARTECQRITDDVRKMAAEQGVSQQAIYFKDEYENHQKQATHWFVGVLLSAIILVVFVCLTTVMHKIPYLVPQTSYDTVQLAVSKVLIFTVLSYFLYFSVKNYMANNHNAVVNKHRQNALLTFNALVDAAGESANHDIILTNAAACIFSPQVTGYIGASMDGVSAESIVKLFPSVPGGSSSNG